jgi:DNA-binding CsgD family transcriptional regulator
MSPMLLQIKELLSRNLDAVEIAHRLHLSVDYVRAAIDILT